MGNNKRPRKLQATNDFPKKKRKLGKRKAIPDNATRVTFKSQSILVPSQLTKPNDEGPSTHRNLTLKDLLKQLSHPKSSIVWSAINGIRELLADNSTHLLISNLSSILTSLIPHWVSFDDAVRHSLYLLLKNIFKVVPSHQMLPYFDTIRANAKCSLTHLNNSIQLFGFKVIDLLLDHYPHLLRNDIRHLLSCYVPIIAHNPLADTKTSHHPKHIPSNATLLSVSSSRLIIFKQILSLLKLSTKPESPFTPPKAPPIIDVAKETIQLPNGQWVMARQHLSSFDFLKITTSSSSVVMAKTPATSEYNHDKDDDDFATKLVGALLESWIELVESFNVVGSSSKVKRKQTKHGDLSESANVLLQLLCLVLDRKKEIADEEKTIIKTHFLPYFPLKAKGTTTLNIRFCYLLILTGSDSNEVMSSVSDFLSDNLVVFCNKSSVACDNLLVLVKIINVIDKCNQRIDPLSLKLIYDVFVKLFITNNSNIISSIKKDMLLYLEQTLNHHIWSVSGFSDSFKKCFLYPCLSGLSGLLCEIVTTQELDLLSVILNLLNHSLSLNIKPIMTSFIDKLSDIYSPDGLIVIVPPQYHLSFFHLLTHVPSFSPSHLSIFSSLVSSHKLPSSADISIIKLLHDKLLHMSQVARCSLSDYPVIVSSHISFLLSLLIGYSSSELKSSSNSIVLNNTLKVIKPLRPVEVINGSHEKIKIIIGCLLALPISNYELNLAVKPVLIQLNSYQSLPIDAVYNLISFLSQLSLSPLYDVLPSLFSACLVSMETEGSDVCLFKETGNLVCEVLSHHPSLYHSMVKHAENESSLYGRKVYNILISNNCQ